MLTADEATQQPVKVAGFFHIENVCRDVAAVLVNNGYRCDEAV
jgi:hypothetical protein